MRYLCSDLENYMVRIAQSVRALDCGSKGRGFESHSSPPPKYNGELKHYFSSVIIRNYLPPSSLCNSATSVSKTVLLLSRKIQNHLRTS